jgi:hypothetical protein
MPRLTPDLPPFPDLPYTNATPDIQSLLIAASGKTSIAQLSMSSYILEFPDQLSKSNVED